MENIQTKTCTSCKKELPKTEDNFFIKITKQQNKSGLAIYRSFRSICKSCNNKKTEENRVKKRCKEMGCNISEYRKKWKEQYTETRTHFKEFKEYSLDTRKRMFKYKEEGNDVSTYKKYKELGKLKISKIRRKYDYGNIDFVPKNTQTGIKHLTDGYIALTLKQRVKEVPKELIEFKRLTIQLKRELKTIKN